MGLFGGTKKFAYRLGKNHAPMGYEEFVDAFRDYAKSDEFMALLKEKDFSVENAETIYEPYVAGEDPSGYPYKMKLTLAPYGKIDVDIEMRGEKQGLALVFFSLTITAELNSSDKAWAAGFCNAIHEHYEKVFAPLNTEKGPLFDYSKYAPV